MPPADETEVYHRMHEWYHSPERDALRAAWGAYPATPGALQAWPGFVRVTNAFLDYEAAHGRSGESVAAEAEESDPVGSSDVRPEVVEGEEGVVTEPVAASETMEREAPAEDAEEESRGWFSSLLGPRRESGAEADAEASEAAPRGVHTLRSWNYPQRRWRVADGDTVMIDEGPATTLRLVPGLYRPGDESGARDWNAKLFAERGAASMVSFALDDGTYLRSNLIGELRAHRPDESRRFRLDATFYAERDRFYPWSVSFHSVNHNGFYISHGSRFVLKTYYCCDEPDLRRETKKNASFALEAPKGWVSSLLGPRRESGAEASEAETEQAAGEARGSVEFLGIWKSRYQYEANSSASAMPTKMKGRGETDARVAFGKLVDELIQTNVSSGILVISKASHLVQTTKFSWSASPDDVSYQQRGFVGMESDRLDRGQLVRYRDAEGSVSQINGDTYDIYLQAARDHVQAARDQLEPIHQRVAFADFEGVVDDLGGEKRMAVYRVTLPSGGLRGKWAGRLPPPAPEDLYTGPRSDELLSTEDISGEYSPPGCSEFEFCRSMTVVPLGADAIETRRTGCAFFPPFLIGPTAGGGVKTRKPGTNAFRDPQNVYLYPNSNLMTFSADVTATQGEIVYKKGPHSQKRTFQKVETRDLAGKWSGCVCIPIVLWPLSYIFYTTKKALNEDQYDESGRCCWLCLPLPYLCAGTRTRIYVNGHPTNEFDDGIGIWYRDPGCALGGLKFAKKTG